MKRLGFLLSAISIIAVLSLSSCKMTMPVSATSNPVGNKVGTSSGIGILRFLVFSENTGIKEAAKNGGITKISTVDFKMTDILGLFQKYECVVTGE